MKALSMWEPPDGAGRPIGCVATTFTFDAEFFDRDCLSRFLGLTAELGEGDRATDLSLLIEMEERLGEASVVVLADRSVDAVPRNLRWDLLPVTIDGGLLHAKTAVLVWERALRLVVGSANLTPAGYRRQVELVVGFDLDSSRSDVSRAIATDLLDEIQLIVDEVPDAFSGATGRAGAVIDAARQHVEEFAARSNPTGVNGVKLAVAPVRAGRAALDGLESVWKDSAKPRRCRALSPFWDGNPGDATNNGVAALASKLPDCARSRLELVVRRTEADGRHILRAPGSLRDSAPPNVDTSVLVFAPDDELRGLHAKCVQYANGNWIAAMVGSSNVTAPGLGLVERRHRELNIWFGARLDSPAGRLLRKLIADDGPVNDVDLFEPEPDEDEVATRSLPGGFVAAVLNGAADNTQLSLHLDTTRLPRQWTVQLAGGDRQLLAEHGDVEPSQEGLLEHSVVIGQVEVIPSVLEVTWSDDDGEHASTWMVVVDDLTALPPPAELRSLPVELILRVLASTRPLRAEFEAQIRERENRTASAGSEVVDPLKQHVLTTALLPRIRAHSAALAGIRRRLELPITSADALDWRLRGALGPLRIAERIADEASSGQDWLPGEAEFLLAELALTLGRVEWDPRPPVTPKRVQTEVAAVVTAIVSLIDARPGAAGAGVEAVPQLRAYIDTVLAEVTS